MLEKGIGIESYKLCKQVKDQKYVNKLKIELNGCYRVKVILKHLLSLF